MWLVNFCHQTDCNLYNWYSRDLAENAVKMQIRNILSLDSNKMAECNVCMYVYRGNWNVLYTLQTLPFRNMIWQVGPVVHIKSTTTHSVVSIRSLARSIIRCVKQCRYYHCDWTNGVRGASTIRIMSNMLTILQIRLLTKVFSHTWIFYCTNRSQYLQLERTFLY